MKEDDIRAGLRDFLGPDRYRRFVDQIARDSTDRQRLRFWQEHCWNDFLSTIRVDLQDANPYRIFLHCYVHDTDLFSVAKPARFPEIRRTSSLQNAIQDSFPFTTGRQLCKECITALDRWIRNADTNPLRRKTTWESYLVEHEGNQIPSFLRMKAMALKIIEESMQDGDELWEYDFGFGCTGLAIIRNGQRIVAWSAPIRT